ncbi:hypothetical protein [Xenorhabdus bovienii]|uniref:hypothetical protein n=1 Tax=Xenorhabdus bovienii TaxID=40576 RepID=UPI00237D040C|nr:hypothetical protein [Xenorhabdus bovienii]MDE1482957.1 hypothetical protein [Xenorhabdus bovienii]MDE9549160.1 hypothetical protein [Xenorhabdus bovienii]
MQQNRPMDDFFGLAINPIVQFGLSFLQVIYYLEQLFRMQPYQKRASEHIGEII